jgi:hypothetical protein
MKVSWGGYSQYMGKIKNDPNHQPGKNINKNIGISYLWRYPDGFTANKTMEKTIVNFFLDPRKPPKISEKLRECENSWLYLITFTIISRTLCCCSVTFLLVQRRIMGCRNPVSLVILTSRG